MELTWQTDGLLMQLDHLRHRKRVNDEAKAEAYTPEEIEAADAEADAIQREFGYVANSSRIMADTPDEEIVPILAVHINDMDTHYFSDQPQPNGWRDWCDRVVQHGGERIDPDWLRVYMDDHIRGRQRDYDPRVKEAMILLDSRVISGRGILMDVDTGKPVPVRKRRRDL